MSAGTQSVLDMMASSIVAQKQAAGAKLTPVGLEAGALPRTGAMFPNDVPDEAILQKVSIIRDQLAMIEQALQAVEAQLAGAQAQVVDPAVAQREKERAADAASAARVARAMAEADDTEDEDPPETTVAAIARVQANITRTAMAAQEAVFGPPATDGWTCPNGHGYILKQSRLGRAYRACPGQCSEFERL